MNNFYGRDECAPNTNFEYRFFLKENQKEKESSVFGFEVLHTHAHNHTKSTHTDA